MITSTQGQTRVAQLAKAGGRRHKKFGVDVEPDWSLFSEEVIQRKFLVLRTRLAVLLATSVGQQQAEGAVADDLQLEVQRMAPPPSQGTQSLQHAADRRLASA